MRLNQFGKSCLALILYLAAGAMPGFGEVLFDDLTDDLDPLEYRSLSSSGSIHFDDQGLSFNTNSPGGIEIRTDDGPLPSSDRWSIRAEFTVNRLTGLGLAGVGITGPDRWAAVLLADHDREYGVGQIFNPDKVKINGVDEDGVQLFGAPFAVQMDFTGDSLAGHFWRPDSATDITTIEYGRMLSSAPERMSRIVQSGCQSPCCRCQQDSKALQTLMATKSSTLTTSTCSRHR